MDGDLALPINSFTNYPMSWKPELDHRDQPLYKALAQQLEMDIETGRLTPGTRLPPQRELADFLDINVSTVSKAFRLCSLKGLLSAQTGSGTFVAYDAGTNWRLALKPPAAIIDMGPTVPDPSAAPILYTLLGDMLKEKNDDWFSYQLEGDAPWQKDIAAKALHRAGLTTQPDQILLAPGGQTALVSLLSAFFRHGDRIAADDHTYPGLKETASLLGLELMPVPQDKDGLSPIALAALCERESIRGLYLIPTCHNPTTITMPAARRKDIAHLVRKYDLLLIEDGTYQLSSPGEPAITNELPDRGLYFASLSKAVAPGLRTTYLSVPPALYSRASEALYSLSISVSPLLAELAARTLASGQLDTILKHRNLAMTRRDAILRAYIPSQYLEGSPTSLFRWLRLPAGWASSSFVSAAMKKGVALYGAEKFSIGKTRPAPAVRLSLSRPKDDADIEKAARILGELLTADG